MYGKIHISDKFCLTQLPSQQAYGIAILLCVFGTNDGCYTHYTA